MVPLHSPHNSWNLRALRVLVPHNNVKKNMGQGHSREPQVVFIPIHTPMLVKLEGNNHPEDRIRIYDTYFILDIPGWILKIRQRHHIMMLSRRNHPIAPTTSGLHRCPFPLVGRWKKMSPPIQQFLLANCYTKPAFLLFLKGHYWPILASST